MSSKHTNEHGKRLKENEHGKATLTGQNKTYRLQFTIHSWSSSAAQHSSTSSPDPGPPSPDSAAREETTEHTMLDHGKSSLASMAGTEASMAGTTMASPSYLQRQMGGTTCCLSCFSAAVRHPCHAGLTWPKWPIQAQHIFFLHYAATQTQERRGHVLLRLHVPSVLHTLKVTAALEPAAPSVVTLKGETAPRSTLVARTTANKVDM